MTFDWWAELRAASVAAAAILVSFLSAWLIEDRARLQTDVVVLAVVLAVMVGRTARGIDLRDRAVAVAVVPVAAACAGELGSLMNRHVAIGDVLFAVAVAAAVWIRRFGPRFSKAGTQATLPFIAVLVIPVPAASGMHHAAWSAVVAVVTVGWVALFQVAAQRLGVTREPRARTTVGPARRGQGPATTLRPVASSRMAIQMGLTLGAAFSVAHLLYPEHWTWLVLTAYIVASGNHGRGDLAHKAVLRITGAAVGTVVATLLASTFGYGDKWAVVAILLTLALAIWLRPLSYAYWAGSVTAALAFLYGYFGQSGTSLLRTRLEGILYGAAIAVSIAWLVLPIKTTDVLRRRIADVLAAISAYLTSARRGDTNQILVLQACVENTLDQLQQSAIPTLRFHRVVTTRTSSAQTAAVVGALTACRDPLRGLTRRLTAQSGDAEDRHTRHDLAALHTSVTRSRRALARTDDVGSADTSDQAAGPGEAPPLSIPEIIEVRRALLRTAEMINQLRPAR